MLLSARRLLCRYAFVCLGLALLSAVYPAMGPALAADTQGTVTFAVQQLSPTTAKVTVSATGIPTGTDTIRVGLSLPAGVTVDMTSLTCVTASSGGVFPAGTTPVPASTATTLACATQAGSTQTVAASGTILTFTLNTGTSSQPVTFDITANADASATRFVRASGSGVLISTPTATNQINLTNGTAAVGPVSGGGGTSTTTTILNAQPNPAQQGATVTLTANVTSSGGTPTGTVQFFNGSSPINSPVTLANGTATTTTPFANAGAFLLTAAYTPASGTSFQPSTSAAVSECVGPNCVTTPTVPEWNPLMLMGSAVLALGVFARISRRRPR